MKALAIFLPGRGSGKKDHKAGGIRVAFRGDYPAVAHNDLFDDGQSQPGAAGVA